MSRVILKHMYKVYEGGVRAVNDFDLEIEDKEFIVDRKSTRLNSSH